MEVQEIFCQECFKGKIKYYCACIQIFICIECKETHAGHLNSEIIFAEYDQNEEDAEEEYRNYNIELEEFNLRGLIFEKLSKFKSEVEKVGKQVKADNENSEGERLGNYTRFVLVVDEFKLNQIAVLLDDMPSIYFPGPDNFIYSMNERGRDLRSTHLQIEKSIIPPFWVLDWNSKLVILGGHKSTKPNDVVFIASVEENVSKWFSIPYPISHFTPIIYKDHLYIIGGKISKGFKNIISNDILVFDLKMAKLVETIKMVNPRFSVSACIANSNLYIMSHNHPASIEYINLEPLGTCCNYETNIDVSINSLLYEDERSLFVINEKGLFVCNDLDNFNFIAEPFAKWNDAFEFSDLAWVRHPQVQREFAIYFGFKQFVYLDKVRKELILHSFGD